MHEARRADFEALAVLETESIHDGLETLDAMAKMARTEIVAATPIPPGRFLITLGGAVGEVEQAYRRGLEVARARHDELFLPDVHSSVYAALRTLDRNRPQPSREPADALGLFETSSVASGLDAADRAVKGAHVRLLQLHVARGIAGKTFGIVEGRQDMVRAALDQAEERARAHARWVGATLLARPDASVVARILGGAWGFVEGQEVL